jgi:hypothetical protein
MPIVASRVPRKCIGSCLPRRARFCDVHSCFIADPRRGNDRIRPRNYPATGVSAQANWVRTSLYYIHTRGGYFATTAPRQRLRTRSAHSRGTWPSNRPTHGFRDSDPSEIGWPRHPRPWPAMRHRSPMPMPQNTQMRLKPLGASAQDPLQRASERGHSRCRQGRRRQSPVARTGAAAGSAHGKSSHR